jgi:hypothetical protein
MQWPGSNPWRIHVTLEKLLRSWKRLGRPRVESSTRAQAHWAVRIPAFLGKHFAEPEADYGHLSMIWDDEEKMLVGAPITNGLRAGLVLADLSLALLDEDGVVSREILLAGKTLDESIAWLLQGIEDLTAHRVSDALDIDRRELPQHEVSQGKPFAAAAPLESEELARWFSNASRILGLFQDATDGASPVRAWPHHFDMATLVKLDSSETNAETARSVTLGMSPGDDNYDEPYFYMTVWPKPDYADLPELAGRGGWHTEGWIGGVLPSTLLMESAEEQAGQVHEFLRSALDAGRLILEG